LGEKGLVDLEEMGDGNVVLNEIRVKKMVIFFWGLEEQRQLKVEN